MAGTCNGSYMNNKGIQLVLSKFMIVHQYPKIQSELKSESIQHLFAFSDILKKRKGKDHDIREFVRNGLRNGVSLFVAFKALYLIFSYELFTYEVLLDESADVEGVFFFLEA